MAKFNLINNVRLGSRRYYAGALFDDAISSALMASLRAAGAVFVDNTNGAVAAAALLAQKLRKRGAPLIELVEVMEASLNFTHERFPKGADLGDADVTIKWSDGVRRVVPAATLTAGRTVTLGVTAGADGRVPKAGARIEVTRKGTEAFTLAFANGGPGAGTLATLVASKIGFFIGELRTDGDWELVSCSAT